MIVEHDSKLRAIAPHLGGAAFVLGHALFILNKLDEMSRFVLDRPIPDLISGEHSLLILIGQLSLIIGYVLYFKFYAPRVGRRGRRALGLLSGGGVILALGHVVFMSELLSQLPPSLAAKADALFLLVIVGVLLLLIGLIWFGILNLRQPVLRQAQWLPLATGLAGLVTFFIFGGEEKTAGHLILRTLFALGLFGMGWLLWREAPEPIRLALDDE
jgi:hypothetical protein